MHLLRVFAWLGLAWFGLLGGIPANANPIRIVAPGAGHTAGSHADGQGWASVPEATRHDGNIGFIDDTGAGILSRAASAIPLGPRIVLLDDDAGSGGGAAGRRANRGPIEQRIGTRGAKPVFVFYSPGAGSQKSSHRPGSPTIRIITCPRVAATVTAAPGEKTVRSGQMQTG
jgi:hypothetical protein